MVDRCFSVNIADQPSHSIILRCVAVNTGGHICVNDNVLDHRTAAGLCEQPRVSAGDVQLQRHCMAVTVEGTLECGIARFCHSNIIGQFEIPAGILPCNRCKVLRRVDQIRIVLRTAARQRHRRRHNGRQHRPPRKRGIILLLALVVPLLPDVLHFGVGRNGICVLRPHRCGNQAGQHDQRQQQRYHSFLHVSFSFSMFNFLCAL